MRSRRPKKARSQKKRIIPRLLVVIVTLFVIFLLVIFFIARNLSSSGDSYTLAVSKSGGDIEVWVVNLREGSIVKIIVPKETEVNLALQRGTLRALSVWKLVESEGLPGQMLADTLMRSFHFPIDHWATQAATRNLVDPHTDMPLVLRLRTLLLLKSKAVEQVDLSETSYLDRLKLSDGGEGYKVTQNMPLTLLSLFVDPEISKKQTAVNIINATGQDQYYLADVMAVFEVLGAKVAPISSSQEIKDDCIVRAVDKKVLKRISEVFNCKEPPGEPQAFDIEVVFGSNFLKRF